MPWVTISEAMEILNLSRRTIWRRIEDGSLKSKSEDGIRLVLIENVEEDVDKVKSGNETKPDGNILSLIENLYELAEWIKENLEVQNFISRLLSKMPNDETIQQQVDILRNALATVLDWYEKIQEGKFKKENLQILFGDLLWVRKEIGKLQKKWLKEMEEEEVGSDDEDLKVAIKQSRIEKEEIRDLIEETLLNIKNFAMSKM
jgi:hypothetical protein